MKYLGLVCLLVTFFNSYSQEQSPTLSVGLDKVLFGKGVIDVELLTDIIAEKQDELKSRIIEQEILEPVFKNTSFATKNYVFSVVHDLLYEKDKNVLKKEVMEQTVNYAVIYAIAELYVQNSNTEDFRGFFKGPKWIDNRDTTNDYSALYNTRLWKLDYIDDIDVKVSKQNKLKNSKTGEYDLSKIDSSSMLKVSCVSFNDLLFDCVLQSIISNAELKNKGFFNKPFYFNLDQFDRMSYYHRFKHDNVTRKLYDSVDKFVNAISDMYESFELLEKYLLKSSGKEFDLDVFKKNINSQFNDLLKDLSASSINSIESTIHEMNSTKDSLTVLTTAVKEYEKFVKELNIRYGFKKEDLDLFLTNNDSLWGFLDLKKSKFESKQVLVQIKLDSLDSLLKKSSLMNDSQIGQRKYLIEQKNIQAEQKKIFIKEIKLLEERKEVVKGFNFVIGQNEDIHYESMVTDSLISKSVEVLNQLKGVSNLTTLELGFLVNELSEELFEVAQNAELILTHEEDLIIESLFENLYFLRNNSEKVMNLAYISFLTKEVLPKIHRLNIKAKGRLSETIRCIDRIAIFIEYKTITQLLGKFNGETSAQFDKIFSTNSSALPFVLKFFEHLDHLDEIETYYYLLEQLKVAGEQCDNREIANAITLITQSVEKYSKFDTDEEHINLNVEEIIGTLYDRYGNRDKNPLNFHLTLGVNNAFALNGKALVDSEGNSIRNLGYASEKIGVRWNLYNFASRHSYLEDESKPRINKQFDSRSNYKRAPLISNIHLLVFGSGLLYQLADAGTTKDIKSTFIGTGLGTTFYNNLNFNVSYMLPIQYDGSTKIENSTINIGFDIYFSEYITALNKKRKENKKAKLAAKYAFQKYEYEKKTKVQEFENLR